LNVSFTATFRAPPNSFRQRQKVCALIWASRTLRLREWCRNQFDQPPDSIVASMGTDIATGLVRPVRDFSATALLKNLTK